MTPKFDKIFDKAAKDNADIFHTWATHAVRLEGDRVEGKITYHSLTEDGKIEFYNIEWPDGILEENIPASDLILTVLKEHVHGPKPKKKSKKKKK